MCIPIALHYLDSLASSSLKPILWMHIGLHCCFTSIDPNGHGTRVDKLSDCPLDPLKQPGYVLFVLYISIPFFLYISQFKFPSNVMFTTTLGCYSERQWPKVTTLCHIRVRMSQIHSNLQLKTTILCWLFLYDPHYFFRIVNRNNVPYLCHIHIHTSNMFPPAINLLSSTIWVRDIIMVFIEAEWVAQLQEKNIVWKIILKVSLKHCVSFSPPPKDKGPTDVKSVTDVDKGVACSWFPRSGCKGCHWWWWCLSSCDPLALRGQWNVVQAVSSVHSSEQMLTVYVSIWAENWTLINTQWGPWLSDREFQMKPMISYANL